MNNINAFCVLKHKQIITLPTVCHIDLVCHGMFAHITSTFYFLYSVNLSACWQSVCLHCLRTENNGLWPKAYAG